MQSTTDAVVSKVGWRILPLVLFLYFVAYLDRVNIGFAAAAMRRDLGYSGTLFGTASGVFFAGYLIAQLPANLMLRRLGARRWIAILMAVWGCLSGMVAFTHTPAAFLTLRFFLGIAEAGFYPGVIYYLSIWLPRPVRTQFTAWFIFAIPMANILGGPLSSAILEHGHMGPLRDWQVLLLVECIPALLAAMVLPFLMTDHPDEATWLSVEEKATLLDAIERGEPKIEAGQPSSSLAAIFTKASTYLFTLAYFTTQVALYGLVFWLPQMLSGLHLRQMIVGWTVSAVFLLAAVIMILWARLSDKKGQPKWAFSLPIAISAIGFLIALGGYRMAGVDAVTVLVVAFAIAEGFGLAATPPLWSAVTLNFPGERSAPAIALINALGNIGGFVGPFLLGWLADQGKGYDSGLFTVAAFLLVGSGLAVLAQREKPAATL